jgi:adenylate cyclase
VLARHWTEAGETEPAIAAWGRAGKAAEARNAFQEALENYQKAVTLLKRLPESPERDSRELELAQSVNLMLGVTRGHSAPETMAAVERVAALAERSGNLNQLFSWLSSRWAAVYFWGDLSAAGALADQLLDLALRDGSTSSLGVAHGDQTITRYQRGDFAAAEKHFTAGRVFFDDAVLRHNIPFGLVSVFGIAGWNAWMLGRTNVARERIAQMTAIANDNNPYALAWSGVFAASLLLHTRE